jgi:predicted  nucleic acid-binding Zn-ribbon protein
VKADPFAQLKLLDVQQLDSRLDQLRHRLRTLPQLAELEELGRTRADLEHRSGAARTAVEDLTRDQKRADVEVEQVKARRKRDHDRIDQGLVNNPKDLERMQHELVSLERRISDLEDAELEVMEQLETAQSEYDALVAQLAKVEEEVSATTSSRDHEARTVEEELAAVAAEREQTATGLPEDLMALYTRLREQKGGVGAAALHRRRCGGCSLELNAAELGMIGKSPSDEVIRCEECNRILVRTSESGV